MSSHVNNYIKLTIPRSLVGDGEVQARVDEVTKAAGGVTTTEAWGDWFDDEDKRHVEQVFVHQWNFGAAKRGTVSALVGRVVSSMWDHGEKAVFRERWYQTEPYSGYRADILYPPQKS